MKPVHLYDDKQIGTSPDGKPVYAFVPRWWQFWRWVWYFRQRGRGHFHFHPQIAYLLDTRKAKVRTYERDTEASSV